jgi:hypothetical protein
VKWGGVGKEKQNRETEILASELVPTEPLTAAVVLKNLKWNLTSKTARGIKERPLVRVSARTLTCFVFFAFTFSPLSEMPRQYPKRRHQRFL